MFCYAIASEQPHCVIASLITIRRSNPLRTLNTKRNVQRGDCFTPTHLQTLRFAMTGREGLAMTESFSSGGSGRRSRRSWGSGSGSSAKCPIGGSDTKRRYPRTPWQTKWGRTNPNC